MGTDANTLNQGSRNLVLVPPPGVSLQPWSEDLKEATEGLLLTLVPVSSLEGRPPPLLSCSNSSETCGPGPLGLPAFSQSSESEGGNRA